MMAGRQDSGTPPPDPTCVTPRDCQRIDQISALLATLNDPSASAGALARHVSAIPVLAARVAARFAKRHPSKGPTAIAQQIALLGNRVLEAILLELLEDIVTLHSEMQA